MCGITGIFDLQEKPVSSDVIRDMANAIAHRGPDGEGYYVNENIGLGHKRLAILDPDDRAAQPMISHNKEWIIVYNGCVYNFHELRLDLRSKGHIFYTTSDTEVIAEGLARYGTSFFQYLNGMFAIAAWNKEEKALYLSRDRFGIKPIYYWFSGNKVVFGSEVKAIRKHPEFKSELNLNALNEYFTFQNLFSFQTFFKDVVLLPPANTVRIDKYSKGVVHQSWWDYDFSRPDENMTFEEAKTETENLMEKAVSRQLVSDVPIGSFLSGGMDSGSIASIASKQYKRLSTFTCGFDMSRVRGKEANFDERRDAELMASDFKTEHFEQVINSNDLKNILPWIVWHLENPRVGMSYPNYYISRLASKFVKVCLQGTGGDELYGGYPWRYYRVFRALNQKEFFNQYYEFWQRLISDEHKKHLFQPKVYNEIDLNEPRNIFERVFTFNKKLRYSTPEEHINNSLYFEIKTFLPGLLIVGDKLSMANGLEERFPFLDNELVNFAQKIPVRHKLGNLDSMKKMNENEYRKKRKAYFEYDDGKNVLRQSMKNFLPDSILKRKKQGFSAPDESWYRDDNAIYIKDLLLNKNNFSHEYIRPEYIKQILEEHLNKETNHRLMIWSLMNFEWWCRLFLDNQEIPEK